VSDCYSMPSKQFFSKNELLLMKWWWYLLCTRPTCWVGFL